MDVGLCHLITRMTIVTKSYSKNRSNATLTRIIYIGIPKGVIKFDISSLGKNKH